MLNVLPSLVKVSDPGRETPGQPTAGQAWLGSSRMDKSSADDGIFQEPLVQVARQVASTGARVVY